MKEGGRREIGQARKRDRSAFIAETDTSRMLVLLLEADELSERGLVKEVYSRRSRFCCQKN
jgi:hypothetical protein